MISQRLSDFRSIWACPHGSGYPLQSFLFVPSQKAFSLISLTHHAEFATNTAKLTQYAHGIFQYA
jgi:hypothetical protein